MTSTVVRHLPSALRRFIDSEASGGLTLVACAAAALLLANSPFGGGYAALVRADLAGLPLLSWVNDGLMPIFFLLVGLEIKRESLHGQLRTWSARILPGLAALGGMVVPALIFAAVNAGDAGRLRGWAIPAATDIAFALGVVALLGDRVPASLKVFLTTLAVLDDLGAILIIALFYSHDLAWAYLGGGAVVLAVLIGLNRAGVRALWPFLALGALLLALVWRSGIHPTIAGVLLAFVIPDKGEPGERAAKTSPLHRLEDGLGPWVAFLVLPLFAFLNAGVTLEGGGAGGLLAPVTVGVAAGLAFGKQIGVLAGIGLGLAAGAGRPKAAGLVQIYGVALLCGIGFTMSLFIGLLAFPAAAGLQAETKIGVLAGSLLSAAAGSLVLALAPRSRAG